MSHHRSVVPSAVVLGIALSLVFGGVVWGQPPPTQPKHWVEAPGPVPPRPPAKPPGALPSSLSPPLHALKLDADHVGFWATGFVTGFLAHESGHILMNLAMGNPQFSIEPLTVWGFLPFVVILPRIRCNRQDVCVKNDGSPFPDGQEKKFAIVTAGFHVQHLTDELLLSFTPDLKTRDAPFREGLLLFNTATSFAYALGGWAKFEDPHGDLVNAANIAHVDERVMSMFLLVPAVLDIYRYFRPNNLWAPWAARTSKGSLVGMNLWF